MNITNMLVLTSPDDHIKVDDEWTKWLLAGKPDKWRTFLNDWRKRGYVKNTYLYFDDTHGESPETGTYYWPIAIFEKKPGIKYRERCARCANCESCKGVGYVWKETK